MMEQKVPYPELDTPALLVDMEKLEANIRESSQLAYDAGLKLRPHAKVHLCADIAKMQIEAGACGIDVGPLGQAEGMAEEGIKDILIAHPGFYGGPKGEALKRLLSKRDVKVTIAVDMVEQAEYISRIAQEVGRKVFVVLKIDANAPAGGWSRYGVLPGKPAVDLALAVRQIKGIELIGIYTHEMGGPPSNKYAFKVLSLMAETARMLEKAGIRVEHVSVGASNTFRQTCRYVKEGIFPELTEIHPGSYIMGCLWYVMTGGNPSEETCAGSMLTTVMSTSHPDWAVIDAGYDALGTSAIEGKKRWRGMPSFGSIRGRPDLWLGYLCTETGVVYYTDPTKKKLSLGERLQIIPNNMLPIVNARDQLYGVRNGMVERVIRVTGRGRGH